jgi:hypothetical protein
MDSIPQDRKQIDRIQKSHTMEPFFSHLPVLYKNVFSYLIKRHLLLLLVGLEHRRAVQ